MSSKANTGQTPANVAAKATQTKAVNLTGLALIGLNGNAGAFTALVRLPGGRIKQVETGARVSGGKIVAIDADGLVLQKNGHTRRIEMPGS